MKDMVYGSRHEAEELYAGKYFDYDFAIISLGSHPTAYVRIPAYHPYYEKDYNDIDIDVHGGLTYAASGVSSQKQKGWWVGWDYAHLGDYSGYMAFPDDVDGRRWETSDIFNHVKSVIRQLEKAEQDGSGSHHGTNK